MGLFDDFKRLYDAGPKVEVPMINVYDPDYIAEKIWVLKSNPIRNRFRLCDGKKRFAVRVTGLDKVTHEPKNVMDCYLCGELCMNRPTRTEAHSLFVFRQLYLYGRSTVVS